MSIQISDIRIFTSYEITLGVRKQCIFQCSGLELAHRKYSGCVILFQTNMMADNKKKELHISNSIFDIFCNVYGIKNLNGCMERQCQWIIYWSLSICDTLSDWIVLNVMGLCFMHAVMSGKINWNESAFNIRGLFKIVLNFPLWPTLHRIDAF